MFTEWKDIADIIAHVATALATVGAAAWFLFTASLLEQMYDHNDWTMVDRVFSVAAIAR